MKNDKLLIANWKAVVTKPSEAKKLLTSYKKMQPSTKKRVIVATPFPFLGLVTEAKLITSAQTVSPEHSGATTGRVPAELLKEIKVSYAIVGHSEERAAGASNGYVNQQIQRLLECGITPIVCVGESQAGSAGFDELQAMVVETFAKLPKAQIEKCILAYEPVWAIGAQAKRPATAHEAHEAILFCKKIITNDLLAGKRVSMRYVYGGSVDPDNAAEFLAVHDIHGLLVGRVSTDAKKFAKLAALI
jgi:triosephosphate isomerase (TIM)